MSVDLLPPWYDVADVVSLTLLLIVPLVAVWGRVDRGDAERRAHPGARTTGPRPSAHRCCDRELCIFHDGGSGAGSPRRGVLGGAGLRCPRRGAPHHVVAGRATRADAVSDLTAPGLTVAVLMAGIGLFRLGRRREISVLLAGTLSAWALFVALKPVFAVARPRVLAHHYVAITSYAFPSGDVSEWRRSHDPHRHRADWLGPQSSGGAACVTSVPEPSRGEGDHRLPWPPLDAAKCRR
jgi:hypothetical protein